MAKFDENSKLGDVMADEAAMEVLKKHAGSMMENPMVGMMKNKTMGQLVQMIPMPDVKAKFETVLAELAQLD